MATYDFETEIAQEERALERGTKRRGQKGNGRKTEKIKVAKQNGATFVLGQDESGLAYLAQTAGITNRSNGLPAEAVLPETVAASVAADSAARMRNYFQQPTVVAALEEATGQAFRPEDVKIDTRYVPDPTRRGVGYAVVDVHPKPKSMSPSVVQALYTRLKEEAPSILRG